MQAFTGGGWVSKSNNSTADTGIGDIGFSGTIGQPGSSWICTATYNEGLITDSHFRTLNKFGIMMRRTDPNLMRGYDIVGPWMAKLVGKNDFTKWLAKLLTNYYKKIYENKSPTLKQKIIFKYGLGNLRPIIRFLGWLSTKIK